MKSEIFWWVEFSQSITSFQIWRPMSADREREREMLSVGERRGWLLEVEVPALFLVEWILSIEYQFPNPGNRSFVGWIRSVSHRVWKRLRFLEPRNRSCRLYSWGLDFFQSSNRVKIPGEIKAASFWGTIQRLESFEFYYSGWLCRLVWFCRRGVPIEEGGPWDRYVAWGKSFCLLLCWRERLGDDGLR